MGRFEKEFGKGMSFEVPAGYFDGLTENIMKSVRSSCPEDFKPSKKIEQSKFGLYLQRCIPYVSMAAIISFVVIMMQLFVVGNYNSSIDDAAVADADMYQFEPEIDLTDEEIIEYLSSSVYDVESFLMSMK